MKRLFARLTTLLALVLAASFLAGCGGLLDDGRMDAWKEVRKAEEETKQDKLDLIKTDLQKKAEQSQNPTLKVTTQDSAGKPVVVEMDLAPTIRAATGHSEYGQDFGVETVTTAMPQGQLAENLEASAKPIRETLHGPATLIYATGKAVGEGMEHAQGDTTIKADQVDIRDSQNRTEIHKTGTGDGSVSMTGRTTETLEEAPAPIETVTGLP